MQPRCSPAANGSVPGTCLQTSDVDTLKRSYNATHEAELAVTESAPDAILSTLKKRERCDNDLCLVDKIPDQNVRQSMLRTRYSPFMPPKWKKNINEWLSSTDIINVLRQYESKYPAFKFLGPSPTDYYFMETPTKCVWRDLCQFNLKAHIASGKTKFGVVFNIDPHDLPGSHWVALYIDATARQIYYFDSTGDEIHEDILRFAREVQQKSRALGPEYAFDEKTDQTHPLEHQYGDTECGMYVLYFIVTMLKNQQPDVYNTVFKNSKQKIPDKAMERLRHEYFNERTTRQMKQQKDVKKTKTKRNRQMQQLSAKYARLDTGGRYSFRIKRKGKRKSRRS